LLTVGSNLQEPKSARLEGSRALLKISKCLQDSPFRTVALPSGTHSRRIRARAWTVCADARSTYSGTRPFCARAQTINIRSRRINFCAWQSEPDGRCFCAQARSIRPDARTTYSGTRIPEARTQLFVARARTTHLRTQRSCYHARTRHPASRPLIRCPWGR
jgi:hypothetical protein